MRPARRCSRTHGPADPSGSFPFCTASPAIWFRGRMTGRNHIGSVVTGRCRLTIGSPQPRCWTSCSAGPPPLYVGFGAISSFVRQKGLSAIKAAIGDRRTLFSPGWSRITTDMLPKNFFVLGDTPHVWLFPLTSMVIHHAGAGTTHTAARSGVPSIPLPFGVDQFFWAARLAAAGVAPRYMAGTRIDAKSLGAMIEFAGEPGVRKRARMLGQAITEEDGIANAVAAIESAMRSGEPVIAAP